MNHSVKKGKFITFDGIDGAGKTTQIKQLTDYLNNKNIDVYVTREPGGTDVSEQIRHILLSEKNEISPITELLLMFASRAEHITQVLRPKIEAGEWVVCSRFTDATLAYQGYGRKMDHQLINQLADIVHNDFNPDMSFFLDLPETIAAQRIAQRNEASDRFENEKNGFMTLVREGYQAIAKNNPKRCKLIDATVSASEVSEQVLTHIDTLVSAG